MPTSVMQRQQGFTLLELLVVLVMMGVILTIAVLSLGDGGRAYRVREEGRRLQALLNLVAEEAVLNSEACGLAVQQDGYRFLRYRAKEWEPFEGDSLYTDRQWPPGVEPVLFVEGRPQAIPDDADTLPAVIFFPDGERTPFELTLAYRDAPQWPQRIVGPLFGPLTVQNQMGQ